MLNKLTTIITSILLSFQVAAQESAVTVFINDLEAAATDIQGLAQKLQAPLTPQMIYGGLGQVIQNPSFAGINKNGHFTFFIGADLENGGKAPMAFVVPLTDDGSTYIDTLKQSLPNHIKKGESLHLFEMTPPGATQATKFVVKMLKGNKALIGNDTVHMSALTKSLNKDDLPIVKALPGKIAFSINTEIMRKAINKQMETQKQMMEMMKAQQGDIKSTNAAGMQPDPAAMMESYNSLMNELFAQFKSFVIGMDVKDNISLNMYASALEGTALQETINSAEAPNEKVKALADNTNSLLSAWGNMKGVSPLMDMYMDWVKELYTSMGPQYEGFTKLFEDESMAEMYKIYEGYSFKMLSPTTDHFLRMVGAYELTDVEKAKAWSKKYIDELNKAMVGIDPDDKEAMFMKITESEPVEENGLEITEYAFQMNFPAMENNPGQPNMDMFKNMKYYQAYKDNYMIYSMGEKALLFEAANTLGGAPAAASTENEILSEWMIDYGKMIKEFMTAFTPAGQPNPLASMPIGSIPLTGNSKKHGEGIVTNLTITQEALQNISGLVMMGMMQKQMQQGQPGAGAPPPGFPPAGVPPVSVPQ